MSPSNAAIFRLRLALSAERAPRAGEASELEIANLDVRPYPYQQAILDDLAARYRINRARVFATGISNGGRFAWRIACETDWLAGIATVGGTESDANCGPVSHPPLLIKHDRAQRDRTAPDRAVPLVRSPSTCPDRSRRDTITKRVPGRVDGGT